MNVKECCDLIASYRDRHEWKYVGERKFIRCHDPRVGCLVDPLAVTAMDKNPSKRFYVADHDLAAAALGLDTESGRRLAQAADDPKSPLRGMLAAACFGGIVTEQQEVVEEEVT